MTRPEHTAFPLADGEHMGMTIREHFACEMAKGLLAAGGHKAGSTQNREECAAEAVQMADALIVALNARGEK